MLPHSHHPHIAINREGALAIFFFLGLAGAAIHSGNNGLILLFCWTFAAAILLCAMALRNCTPNLLIQRRFSEELFAQRDTRVDVIITNTSHKTLYGLHIFERFENNRTIGPIFVRKLPPDATVTAQYLCRFVNRGYAHFSGFEVRSRFPLPFFELRYPIDAPDNAFIYPEPKPGRDLIQFACNPDKASKRLRSSHQVTFRELEHGRKSGKILWKLSAKKQKWIEAVPLRTAPQDLTPVIQIQHKKEIGSAAFENQLSQITHFVLKRMMNDQCGIVQCDNIPIEYTNTPQSRRKLLEFLATL